MKSWVCGIICLSNARHISRKRTRVNNLAGFFVAGTCSHSFSLANGEESQRPRLTSASRTTFYPSSFVANCREKKLDNGQWKRQGLDGSPSCLSEEEVPRTDRNVGQRSCRSRALEGDFGQSLEHSLGQKNEAPERRRERLGAKIQGLTWRQDTGLGWTRTEQRDLCVFELDVLGHGHGTGFVDGGRLSVLTHVLPCTWLQFRRVRHAMGRTGRDDGPTLGCGYLHYRDTAMPVSWSFMRASITRK